MSDDHFQDLKQFIEATVSQSESPMTDRMDQRFEEVVDGTNQQTETIIDHIDRTSVATSSKFNNHEERLSRLDRHIA